MKRLGSWRAAAVLAAVAVGGCQQHPQTDSHPAAEPTVRVTPAPLSDFVPSPAPPRQSGPVLGAKEAATEPLVQLGRDAGAGMAARAGHAAGGDDDVTLTFVDTDIREIARSVLGGILKVNYTIDPNVHGSATYETTKPLARSELIPVLSMLLSQNGATVVERDGTFWVLPTNMAAAAAGLPGPGGATTGSEVVPLRFASAAQLAHVLEPYAADTGRITADPARNALLVSGDGGARASLIALIRAFDIDILANQSYALFPVSSSDPAKAAQELQKALATEGDGRLAGLVRVVPMERTNAVLVISSQPRYIADVRRLYDLIAKAQAVTARSWYVYYVQNGEATELERLLQRAFTPGKVSSQSTGGVGSTTPGADTVSLGSGMSSGGNGQANGGTSTGSSAGATPSSATGSSQTGTSGQGAVVDRGRAASDSLSAVTDDAGSDNEKSNGMRIIGNRRSNSLLIFATPDEYSTVQSMLAKVDVLPLQVLIEATIAEVTLNDSLQYGTQFFFKDGGLNGTLSNIASSSGSAVPITSGGTGVFGGTYPAFVLNKTSGAVKATLSALQDVTEVKVLSSPQILVLDNEKAQLVVGNDVPVITQSATSIQSSNSVLTNTVDYHSTGVILQVVPRVNSGGLVTLEIAQEVSDVVSTTSSTINSPTFEERKVKSRVVVQDGQTVGLAGLIRDTASQGNSGIPFLKDIPFLGSLVSSQDNTRTRTELLVLLTPRVVHDQRDARALTEDMRKKLFNADLVPAGKAGLAPSGSPNPNGDYVP